MSTQSLLKRDPVIDKQEPIVVSVVAVVAEAIPDIQDSILRKCESKSGREVAKNIFAAEPVRHNVNARVNWLLITNNGSRPRSNPDVSTVHDSVKSSMEPRTVHTGFDFLTKHAIWQAEGRRFLPMIDRRIENHPCCRRQAFHIIFEKPPLDIGLDENALAEGTVDAHVSAGFEIRSNAEDDTRIVDIQPVRRVGMWDLRQKVEFEIDSPFIHRIGCRDIE